MKYNERVLQFTYFYCNITFQFLGWNCPFIVSTAVSNFRAKCYQLEYTKIAFFATAQNIQKIKLDTGIIQYQNTLTGLTQTVPL